MPERIRSMADLEAVSMGHVKCVREGRLSFQVQSLSLGRIWLPREAMHPHSDVWKRGDEGELRVRRWWAIKHEKKRGTR